MQSEPVGRPRTASLLLPLLLLLLAPLPWIGDLRHHLEIYLPLTLTATLLLLAGWWWIGRRGEGVSHRIVIAGAILLRLAMLPMEPSLSDDLWRYLWDGRLVLHGVSPYHHAPADSALAPFHDRLLARQGYPTTNTVYPPGAQLIFALGAAPMELAGSTGGGGIGAGMIGYKLLVIAAEIGTVLLLLQVLAGWGVARRHALLYAWHPLPIIELAGQGHTDAFWALALVAGVALAARGRSALGAAAVALGGTVRLYPLGHLPLWLRSSGANDRRGWRTLLLLLLPLLLFLPLLDPVARENMLTVAARFTNYFEFNGGVYLALKGLLDELHIAPSNTTAGAICTGMIVAAHLAIWLLPRRRVSAQLLASLALWLVTAQIVPGAKVHVWYFSAPLALLPLLPAHPLRAAWLWLTLVAPLTYLYYAVTPPAESPLLLAVEWGGFVLLGVAGVVRARRGGLKTAPPPESQ